MNENFEMLCWGLCRESCNQGVFMSQELEKQELEEARFTIDVNLMGTFHLIKAPLSRMKHWKEAWTNVDRHYIIVGQSGTCSELSFCHSVNFFSTRNEYYLLNLKWNASKLTYLTFKAH